MSGTRARLSAILWIRSLAAKLGAFPRRRVDNGVRVQDGAGQVRIGAPGLIPPGPHPPADGRIDQRLGDDLGEDGSPRERRAKKRRRKRQAPPDQPGTEHVASPREPALDGTHRPVQERRDFLVRPSLEIAEDHGQAILVGETIDLVVEDRAELVPGRLILLLRTERLGRHGHAILLLLPAVRRPGTGPHGDPIGHLVKP